MLLAANPGDVPVAQMLFWSAVLVVLVVVGMAFALRLKRRLKQDDDAATAAPAAGFTLSDLRQMHRAGQLTEEEFAKAKEKIVAAAQKAAERAAPKGEPPPRDSTDAIRARRLAREEQQRQQSQHPPDPPPPDAQGADGAGEHAQ